VFPTAHEDNYTALIIHNYHHTKQIKLMHLN